MAGSVISESGKTVTPHYRGENLGSLAEVWRAKKANEQGFAAEAELNNPPPPDPEITKRWASVLKGGVYFIQNDGTVKDGPQTSGAERRLATLQKSDTESL